ncbi:mechanosensitive ion channel family protein [Luteolibacter sp. AS25]|uniref:mechanosensitive ion channel family protein n=1 Tax=Luteolibacter sp. AS25 TaxID=3135776 RepID=UPI00398AB440
MTRFFSLTIACCGLAFTSLSAQDASEQPQTTDTATEVSDPLVPLDILKLRLTPLTQDELKAESETWQSLVKEKSTRISEMEIQLIEKKGNQDSIRTELLTLRDEKAKIISRAQAVLSAYELKGGDASNQRKYLAATEGIEANLKNLSTRYHLVINWLKSEEGGFALLGSIIKFLLIVIVFSIIAAVASKIIKSALDKEQALSSLQENFINKMSKRAILAIGFIVALGTIGVNVGAALALIGGGAFILAFALQDSLSNFASGVMLLIYRPFDVGDAVEVGGISGSVDNVSLVSTTIRTFDNKKVLLPNSKVWGETITNITGMPNRRVDMMFGIGYNDDIDKAQEILERIVDEHELTLEIPEPTTKLHELGESSVNFICRPWAKTSDHWTVYWDITKRVKQEFDAAGISIPFPQRDIHVYQAGNSGGQPVIPTPSA